MNHAQLPIHLQTMLSKVCSRQCITYSTILLRCQRRKIMAKGQQSKKDEKKKPEKTLKEKRAEKRAKKESN